MKKMLILLASSLCFTVSAIAAAAESGINTVCPISGKAADPKVTFEYEGRTYAFADEASRKSFQEARAASLYQRLGGQPALEAAVERFYEKVLADKRVNYFFEDVSMVKQKRKQKEFLAAALGGPIPYVGKDLRKAHADMDGLNDTHFDAIAEHLQSTLEELKVDKALIAEVMAIVSSTRNAVLNRPEAPAKN